MNLSVNHIDAITEHWVPEVIPVLGSQSAGDVSHKPGGRLPLLSARPAVTPAILKRVTTNFSTINISLPAVFPGRAPRGSNPYIRAQCNYRKCSATSKLCRHLCLLCADSLNIRLV